MRSDAIKPGDVIAGKYRVRAILSRTRGFLVEAFHTEFDQRVAIRVLSSALVDEKEVERFRREARTLAKLESEYVARIVDVGKTQDGAFYFARQYLEGQDLAATLKQRGPLPLAEAVLYVLQASEAVAECHANSILLREMMPSHLFLTQRLGGSPQVKVTDFGTAKLMREAAAPTAGGELTATAMFGLSSYSSPELVRKAQHVDPRTDVWSLGAILYQLLTARPPFEGEMAALMLAITRDDPIPATRYRRDLPPEIDQIIGWALAKDVDGRFANVHGFAHALLPYASPEGQMLVQRIGEITQAARRRRASTPAPAPQATQAAAMDRDNPETVDGNDLLEDDDDDPRTAYRPPGAPVVSPTYQPMPAQPPPQEEAQPLDRTLFIGPNYSAPSPVAAPPPAAGRGSQPAFAGAAADPAPHPAPVWQPMPQPMAQAGVPAMPPPQQQQQHHAPLGPRAALATIQSSSIPNAPAGAKPQPKGAKVALAAVAGAVVLLSVVAVVVVLKGQGPETTTGVEGVVSAKATTSASAAPPASATEAPVASAAPSADPAPTADPTPPPPATVAAAPTPAHPTGKLPGKPVEPRPDPRKKPDPTPPSAGSGDTGTLVAVAVGGTCAFSVNGASKGTTSTLKLSLKPGTYSVTCAPSTGASKSKSVTVTSGSTAMAMFKL